MVEDKKNNDTKEELETSKDDKKMDTQQVNENKDSKNIELDSEKENELTEDNEKEITETETKEKEIQEGQENEDKVTDIKEEDDPNAKWYVVGAASGFEERAVKTIQDNARKASLSHFFLIFKFQNKRWWK